MQKQQSTSDLWQTITDLLKDSCSFHSEKGPREDCVALKDLTEGREELISSHRGPIQYVLKNEDLTVETWKTSM